MIDQFGLLNDDIDGVVIYTDGSSSAGGMGFTGGGIHGYTYKLENLKRGLGLGKWKTTASGYEASPDDKDTVTPVEYFDGTMSTHWGTNNTAELKAGTMGVELASQAAIMGAKRAVIRADSKYVIEGIMTYMPRWHANGWIKNSGQPVANMDLWQRAWSAKETIDAKDIDFNITWVAGHSGEPGNDAADRNALIGKVLNDALKSKAGEDKHQFVISPPTGYWRVNTDDKVSMIQGSVLVFDGTVATPEDHTRYHVFTNHDAMDGANDMTRFGMADETACYGVVQLKEASTYINGIMSHQTESIPDDALSMIDGSVYYALNTRVAFAPNTLSLYQRQRNNILVPYGALGELRVLTDDFLTKAVYPVRMSLDGVGIVRSLESILDVFLENRLDKHPIYKLVDVTEFVYDMAKSKKGTTYKLKDELNSATGKLDLCEHIPEYRSASGINALIMSFGSDLPRREIVAAAAKHGPKAYVVTWEDSGSRMRAFILETEEGVGMWHNPWRSVF